MAAAEETVAETTATMMMTEKRSRRVRAAPKRIRLRMPSL